MARRTAEEKIYELMETLMEDESLSSHALISALNGIASSALEHMEDVLIDNHPNPAVE